MTIKKRENNFGIEKSVEIASGELSEAVFCNKKYGLLGKNIGHSLSPRLHAFFGEYDYDLVSLDSKDEIPAVLSNLEYDGFNVTSPYKQDVVSHLDLLSDEAAILGAVNTIARVDGKLIGYNTDVYGFEKLIGKNAVEGKKVLVLGSGGASRAARLGLKNLGASEIVVCSRNSSILEIADLEKSCLYEELGKHVDAQVIINATPVGMHPSNGRTPFDLCKTSLADFTHIEIVIDLLYNPYRSKFLQEALEHGIEIRSGLRMLVYQAIKSNAIWTGSEPKIGLAEMIYDRLLHEQLNITLIGMPGCGKTTTGKILADELDRPFIDTDDLIEEAVGMPVQEFIEQRGEDAFRDEETKVIKNVCGRSGCVIATGGGSVLREENQIAIVENSLVLYLDRPLSELAADGRPITKKKGLEKIYEERAGIYERLADRTLDQFNALKELEKIRKEFS